jgi:hypothetical protein
LVRRLSDSVKYFELTIKKSILKNQNIQAINLTDDKVINGDIYTSLRRVLSIYTKITPEPQKAILFLKKYSNDKSISKMTRIEIGSWIQALEKWRQYDFNKIPSINDFVAKNLASLESSELSKAKIHSGENDITLLISSGVLSKYLNDNPQTDVTPEILYWLAVAERRLSSTYFFSLSDIYLKECIVQFSSSPYAKKCYQEYEDNIQFGYSGSAGTDIPVEEKRELDRLKKIIK